MAGARPPKHAVITGANRGIGAALAAGLAASGWDVTGTARKSPDLPALDVTDPESHRAFAARLDGRPIDLLICNAGVYLDQGQGLADGFPAPMWAETFATNVTGVFLTVQALLPDLQSAAAGKIAIISSQMASHARAGGAPTSTAPQRRPFSTSGATSPAISMAWASPSASITPAGS